MSYFQKHVHRAHNEIENMRPSLRQKKTNLKTQPTEHHRSVKQQSFEKNKPIETRPSKKKNIQRELPGLMLEGENSMEQLLNSSINQFTKYLSDRDPLQQEHQQLVAQNKDLRKTLQKLKTIIKQKLVSALSKQKQQLNTVMDDYVQLITKLLADKQELTSTLQQLQSQSTRDSSRIVQLQTQLQTNQQQIQHLTKQNEIQTNKIEQLSKDREQHITKTKHQIDQFLKIIQQYQEESQQEEQEAQGLRERIRELEEQLEKVRKVPPKTQTLLQMLEKAQEENKILKQQLSQSYWEERMAEVEREHEQEFIEYERAMKQTLSKKDQCIQRLNSIIENYRNRKDKDQQ